MARSDDKKIKLTDDDEKLNEALENGEEKTVLELCQRVREGPNRIITVHGSTVLNIAIYYEEERLSLNLMEQLRTDEQIEAMMEPNYDGLSVLHDAATTDTMREVAEVILRKAPGLLESKSRMGETALFRSASYGKIKMFEFLDEEVNKHLQDIEEEERERKRRYFYQREDGSTMLHISIIYQHFDLALSIAKGHDFLIDWRDEEGMTPLQLLLCNPLAFKSGIRQNHLERLIYHCVSTGDSSTSDEVKSRCKVPLLEDIRRTKKTHESAMRLAKFLIEKDMSWTDKSNLARNQYEATESGLRLNTYGLIIITGKGATETPLFLAVMKGIKEIVEEILEKHLLSIQHVDAEGQNLLHVAIRYRQMRVFDFIEKDKKTLIRWITRRTDNNGNSILHMVGLKKNDKKAEDMRSPAIVLQEDLLLFERINKITDNFYYHRNNEGLTAGKQFAISSSKLQSDAKEWLKRTAENCSIVAVLIATVAFAAAYTVPGGLNQETGYPILINQPFFIVFTMTDVLSLTFALTSVITFLSILTSPFQLKDFKQTLPLKLMLGMTLLILSVSMMMLAFIASFILLINKKKEWTKISLYAVALFPITIFLISYLSLYIQLMKTIGYSIKKFGRAFPRFDGYHESKSTIRSEPIQSPPSCSSPSTQSIGSQTNRSLV